MSVTPPKPPPTWPPNWARSVGFVTGTGLIVWESTFDASEHMVVYAVAFFLTGLPLASGVEKLLDFWGRK